MATVPGFTFRETMTGGFALGETDPIAGERRGKAAGTLLSMHATITIGDVKRFAADPQHAGAIAGSVEYAPLGGMVETKRGVFKLFAPTGDPKLTHMVYELAFEHQGREFYLAGKKFVKDDPGLDLWSDTTSLHVQLHQGGDASGPVVGAGVLSLNMRNLLRLALTMRAKDARTMRDKIGAYWSFFRFFLRGLFRAYRKR